MAHPKRQVIQRDGTIDVLDCGHTLTVKRTRFADPKFRVCKACPNEAPAKAYRVEAPEHVLAWFDSLTDQQRGAALAALLPGTRLVGRRPMWRARVKFRNARFGTDVIELGVTAHTLHEAHVSVHKAMTGHLYQQLRDTGYSGPPPSYELLELWHDARK